MRVLITGGTGTISSGLVQEAVNRGYETYAITRGNCEYKNVPGAHYINGDLFNRDSFIKHIQGIYFDVVVECLVFNTEQLMYSLKTFEGLYKQYIFISTAVLEIPDPDFKVSENSRKDYSGREYIQNKIACEEMLADYFRGKTEHYSIVRPFFTYGAYHIRYGADSVWDEYANIYRIKNGLPVVCYKTVKVPLVYIEDFSRGVVSLFDNPQAYSKAFHIAESGKETTWEEVYYLIAKALETRASIIHLPSFLFKIFLPQRYEAIVGERGRTYSVIDSNLKQAVPSFSQNVNNELGVQKTVDNIIIEHRLRRKPMDMEYQSGVESALVYAFNRNLITKDERAMLNDYYDRLSIGDLELQKSTNKLKEFYDILIKWIIIKQNKQEIGEFLQQNGISSVAIYGLKELGEVLYDDLILSGIKVQFCIDVRAEEINDKCEKNVITPDQYQDVSQIDAVIVTAIHYYEDIFLKLWKKNKTVPVLSLEYLVDEILITRVQNE